MNLAESRHTETLESAGKTARSNGKETFPNFRVSFLRVPLEPHILNSTHIPPQSARERNNNRIVKFKNPKLHSNVEKYLIL